MTRRPAKALVRRRGSLLFAHFGLSGPVILDVSRAVSGHAQPQALTLVVDLLPGKSEVELPSYYVLRPLLREKSNLPWYDAAIAAPSGRTRPGTSRPG